jgi:hypothetical protein
MTAELEFAIDLDEVRDRLRGLKYFTSVETLQEANLDPAEMSGIPPMAFVAVASETAERNKLIGTLAQRVTVRISTLFCIPAERADENARDELDEARRAVIRILLGWTPTRALDWLEYDRFLFRASRDGLLWGEVIMSTSYRLELA